MPSQNLQRADRPDTPIMQTAHTITQTTAVEQARAVAEVQAAVVVAQQVPRDMGRVWAEMRDACGRLGLANRAFYQVPNRGAGPSVHLARELARIFGNVQYGVHELRRDDEAGMSEVQAFAWDVEKNTRSTRTFQVPHQRMVNKKRTPLTDLGDVYLNNQNIGARAVRECIFTVLPADFTDEAQGLCRHTLNDGEGKPLTERVNEMVTAFAREFRVSVAQIETKLRKPRSAWQPGDVAQMQIVYGSLSRGEVTVEDEFPQKRVTVDELGGGPVETREPAAAPASEVAPGAPPTGGEGRPHAGDGGGRPEPRLSDSQRAAITAAFTRLKTPPDDRLTYLTELVGRDLPSGSDLTAGEADQVLEVLGKAKTIEALQAAVAAYADERAGGESDE